MIPLTAWAGSKVALFGLGGSGLATAQCLAEGGAHVIAFDDNPDAVAKAADQGVPTADLRNIDWSAIAALVLAPGVPLTHPAPHWSVKLANAARVPIIGDVALFADERRRIADAGPFIAITGTNGKSTTTALTAHVLACAGQSVEMGGNIGTPVLELAPPAPNRTHVVECSSYQIDLAPDLGASVGILLNLTPDHLERHGTMEHYAAVKARLIESCKTAIVGIDDPWCRAIADAAELRGQTVFRLSVEDESGADIHFAGTKIVVKGAVIADLDGIMALRGSHNAQNAACAVGAALALGVDPAAIQAGLVSFPGLRHRMQPAGRSGKVLFVNDSKATNADAAAHALASFKSIYWIAGGRAKSGGIDSLNKFFPNISKAYLIGEAADAFAASLGTLEHEISGSIDRAVAHAASDAEASDAKGPVVLLSPACASFDQYRNFELRGDAFLDAVARVPGFRTGAG